MQDADLLAQHSSDNKQRFDQHSQVGQIFDQFLKLTESESRCDCH
jgi:hypothetical protein